MNIQQVKIDDIKPYFNNVKVHPQKQIDAIAESIKQFGFRQPIVLDKDNVIVAGHARYEAARLLELEDVPCEYVSNLTASQVKAYRILDNKIAEMGATDMQILDIELATLDFNFEPFNVDLSLPDFSPVDETMQGKLDEKELIKCPHCSHEFSRP